MRLTVRVTPNASNDDIQGRAVDDAGREFLKLKVRAVPEGGKANRAVEKLLAKALKLPKSAVRVVTGETSRIKGVDIDTEDGSAAARQIEEWMGHGQTD
ncbi:DUF167 family protein [Henriciella mobilis]|uniref:UPF0235 protein D1223_03395 n=1 Tax=Henriciella mobilis TaxID=2305467 RepID=A0A399RRK4_9PROT|nr:DUF167 family protein [Henriciella mobilis]RIJ32904.1 DUF167 domain-containing protein [Henriciella mobilis]